MFSKFLFLPLLFPLLSLAQTYQPGQTYFAQNNYAEYRAGTFPIVITAPHGGDLAPSSIPDRTCPEAVTVNDANTQALARQLDTALQQRLGCLPHVVIARLARRKLDPNRDLSEAACGNAAAGQAWLEYHTFIDSARAAVTARYGRGLLIDLHGHAHAIARLELGYLLSASELRRPDDTLNLPVYVAESSIRHLVGTSVSGATHADLLRDSLALGSLLAVRGYPAVPSLPTPYPLVGEAYFNGGYTTFRHGSSNGSNAVDAIQIECYFAGVRDTWANRHAFADSLASALEVLLERHYFGPVLGSATISGEETVCESGVYVYTVPTLPGATCVWTVDGGQILNGQGTPQIQVRWLTPGGGNISVAVDSCSEP